MPDDDDLQAQVRRYQNQVENLRIALKSSRQIGMAVGVLMGRYGLTEDAALEALTRTSRDTNRKMRDIAVDVVSGKPLPTYGTSGRRADFSTSQRTDDDDAHDQPDAG